MTVGLGINLDHVATLRQQRLGSFPDPLEAALLAQKAGADAITVHLREDRRHIQDLDVLRLKRKLKVRLNLEMSCAPAIVDFACRTRPDDCCLVPEKRRELTTEGGLDVAGQLGKVSRVVRRLKKAGIRVSLFIDPEVRQVEAAASAGADCVELHTGAYAASRSASGRRTGLRKLLAAGRAARRLGLLLNAGHGLDSGNVGPVARIPGMNELNIGFAIVGRAIFAGLAQAIQEMKRAIQKKR